MGALVKRKKVNGELVEVPVRYPITKVVSGIIGVPSILCFCAIVLGGASVSGQLLLIALVVIIFFIVVGISFCTEADAKGYW